MYQMNIITVSALNTYIKSLFDSDRILPNIFIEGEISNLSNHYRSGHIYFSLKDNKSTVKAVMFSSQAARLRFKPEEGMKIIARCRVSVYEATGQYQLYVEDMQPDGAGALAVAFEQLKSKLSKEGLFDESRKRKLPSYPEKIAVITSPTGAAVQDIINILGRRYPLAEVILCPVTVQGSNAAREMVDALDKVNYLKCADVIIIGRGGGSAEDLWAFNDELLARTVAMSEIPVISAVGHETDFTICDFAADLRAPTPSAAAELAVPDINEINSMISSCTGKITSSVTAKVQHDTLLVDKANTLLKSYSSDKLTAQRFLQLDSTVNRFNGSITVLLQSKGNELSTYIEKLNVLSPLNVLARGYAIASKDKKSINSISVLTTGDNLNIRLADGEAECTVKSLRRNRK